MKNFNECLAEFGEIGYVDSLSNSVAYVSGLPTVCAYELVIFESGAIGYVLSLRQTHSEILLFSPNGVKPGMKVARTKQLLTVKIGKHLLGKTIDPFGKPHDPGITIDDSEGLSMIIDRHPPGISSRKRIKNQFETGVSVVDLVLPLGKGQRQLLIGDRKSGKTNFLLQSMLTQAKRGTICIYVAIGKKQSAVKKIEEFLSEHGIADTSIIIASFAQNSSGTTYVTPYTGMTIAEYFASQGNDVLVIFDDLTTHARCYREISLLIKRFPGRNSYPADVFYAHSRLLERAGNFVFDSSGKENSITCFPVAETVEGDLSGFIQTNLMSMTDGHLYFDSDLFAKGRRPAIHPFLSVTRVGRQTQSSLHQSLNREIVSFLSLYDKMQNFTHFGAEVSETISHTLKSGEKIIGFFEQLSYTTIPHALQIFLFSLVWIDTWQNKTVTVMKEEIAKIRKVYDQDEPFQTEIKTMLEKSKSFNELLGEIRGKSDEFYRKLGLQ